MRTCRHPIWLIALTIALTGCGEADSTETKATDGSTETTQTDAAQDDSTDTGTQTEDGSTQTDDTGTEDGSTQTDDTGTEDGSTQTDDVSTDDASTDDASTDDASTDDASTDDASTDDASTQTDDTDTNTDDADASTDETDDATNEDETTQIDLTGKWLGTYSCSQGLTALTLQITHDLHNDQLSAVFAFYSDASNPEVPTGRFNMTGTYATDTHAVDLDYDAWIDQPDGYVMVSLDGFYNPDDHSITGEVWNYGCDEFEVFRD